MRGELKKYRLRATRKPAKNRVLSSTVIVRNEAGEHGYCYVNFDAPMVDAVGKVLPRGVSQSDPAHLEVVYYPRTSCWLVTVGYIGGSGRALLWRSAQKPAWLNFHKVGENDREKACDPNRGGDTASPHTGGEGHCPRQTKPARRSGRTEEEIG